MLSGNLVAFQNVTKYASRLCISIFLMAISGPCPVAEWLVPGRATYTPLSSGFETHHGMFAHEMPGFISNRRWFIEDGSIMI